MVVVTIVTTRDGMLPPLASQEELQVSWLERRLGSTGGGMRPAARTALTTKGLVLALPHGMASTLDPFPEGPFQAMQLGPAVQPEPPKHHPSV